MKRDDREKPSLRIVPLQLEDETPMTVGLEAGGVVTAKEAPPPPAEPPRANREEGTPSEETEDGSHLVVPVDKGAWKYGDNGELVQVGEMKIGDVVRGNDAGRWIVVGFKDNGEPKTSYRVWPRFTKGMKMPPRDRTGDSRDPRHLAAYIRQKTKYGKDLVDFQIQVAKGRVKVKDQHTGKLIVLKASIKDRQQAVAWLTERGWGKSVDKLEVSGPDGAPLRSAISPLADLTYEQLVELATLGRARALPGRGGGGGDEGADAPGFGGAEEEATLLPAHTDGEASDVPEPEQS